MYDHENERLRNALEDAIRYADEKCPPLLHGNYCELMADYLLAHGVVALPPGVKPVVRAVRERICNQFLVTKETRIQWSEQATLCSEEKAERMAHEFINDWDARWNRRADTERSGESMSEREKPHHPHSKTRQNLRERLMREQVDRRIEERREPDEKLTDTERSGE